VCVFLFFACQDLMSLPTNSPSMAPRAPDPRLGDSEGAILHWDLSSPTPGTPVPTASSSTATASTLPASHTTSPSTAALSSPAPQISPRATLPQAHDSNICALTFHLLGHLLASNDHTTHFCARKHPGDAASVFAPGGAKPAATGSDDDADEIKTTRMTRLSFPALGGLPPPEAQAQMVGLRRCCHGRRRCVSRRGRCRARVRRWGRRRCW
jgi:hypothetical protein